jgi:hypothetical protein
MCVRACVHVFARLHGGVLLLLLLLLLLLQGYLTKEPMKHRGGVVGIGGKQKRYFRLYTTYITCVFVCSFCFVHYYYYYYYLLLLLPTTIITLSVVRDSSNNSTTIAALLKLLSRGQRQ